MHHIMIWNSAMNVNKHKRDSLSIVEYMLCVRILLIFCLLFSRCLSACLAIAYTDIHTHTHTHLPFRSYDCPVFHSDVMCCYATLSFMLLFNVYVVGKRKIENEKEKCENFGGLLKNGVMMLKRNDLRHVRFRARAMLCSSF